MFGTFRDKLKDTDTSYKGGSEEKVDAKTVAIHDRKASLNSLPDPGFAIYITLNTVIWIFFIFCLILAKFWYFLKIFQSTINIFVASEAIFHGN